MGCFKELSIQWMEEIEKYNDPTAEPASLPPRADASETQLTPLWLEILPLFGQLPLTPAEEI